VKQLLAHDWPGNVRELENCIERMVVLSSGGPLGENLLEFSKRGVPPQDSGELAGIIRQLVRTATRNADTDELHEAVVRRVERDLIAEVLRQSGNVQSKAARRLGISRNTLHKKLTEFG
jgi:DNA-binding NtrC family response regulator